MHIDSTTVSPEAPQRYMHICIHIDDKSFSYLQTQPSIKIILHTLSVFCTFSWLVPTCGLVPNHFKVCSDKTQRQGVFPY